MENSDELVLVPSLTRKWIFSGPKRFVSGSTDFEGESEPGMHVDSALDLPFPPFFTIVRLCGKMGYQSKTFGPNEDPIWNQKKTFSLLNHATYGSELLFISRNEYLPSITSSKNVHVDQYRSAPFHF
jgi:hypothetical protein